MSTVGVRIEELAKKQGLPPAAALAALFGVSYETLRKWRGGETAPNRNRAAKISEVLGVPPEVFLHGVSAEATGTAPELSLTTDEHRLLRAYRNVLKGDRTRVLDGLERRAEEIQEIARTIRIES